MVWCMVPRTPYYVGLSYCDGLEHVSEVLFPYFDLILEGVKPGEIYNAPQIHLKRDNNFF